MEFRGHHVHAARRLAALLAQETDDDAAYDLGGQLRLLVSGVGGPLRHRERSGSLLVSTAAIWVLLHVFFYDEKNR